MYESGYSRHDQRVRHEDECRRRLRAGIATVALQLTRGQRQQPTGGTFHHAMEMAQRHNERTLERWERKARRTIVSV